MASEDNFKELTAKRSSIKGRVTKFKNNLDILETLEDISPIELSKLAMKLTKFEALFIEFDEVQSQIEIINIDKQEAELTVRELIEQDFYQCIAFAKSLLEKNTTPMPSQQNSSSHHSCCHNHSHTYDTTNPLGFRLPEIKIPPFEGTYYKWLEFKEIFTSLVHQNERIKNIHKFVYLSSYLQGEASRVISNLEISDKNYNEAWKLLCSRYDNKRQLIANHLKSLFSIESFRESDKSLRFIIDHITKNLRALNSLGLPTDKWDVLIIHQLANKLDNNTYIKWEEHRNDLPEIPTLEQFFSFLKNRADVLETAFQRSRQDKSEKPKYNPTFNQKGQQTKSLYITSPKENNSSNSSFKRHCEACQGDHHIFQCSLFKDKPVNERRQLVSTHKLCTNCLKAGHKSQDCKLPGSCRICKLRHNTLLHESNKEVQIQPNGESFSMSIQSSPEVLLCTAKVQVTNPISKETAVVRALLDCGSQSSFLVESVMQKLNISSQSSNTEVIGIGSTPLKVPTKRCAIKLQSCDNGFSVAVSCLVLPHISGEMPKTTFDVSHLQLHTKFQLADPDFNRAGPIDMLIGADLFWDIIGSKQHSLGPGNPTLRSSKLGWLIAGPIFKPNSESKSKKVMCNFTLNDETNLHDELAKFWEIENFPQTKVLTKEENQCEQHFLANTTRTPDGHFCVALPLREDPSLLGDNYSLAKKRLLGLEARFRKQPETKQAYTDFMREYEALGHLSKLPKNSSKSKNAYYLPHHPVIKDTSESTKTRVVFEANSKSTSGVAVNDLQMIGPTIQDTLFNILVRFRQHKYVFCADIEKMFRAIFIRESDRYLQQVLWREHETDPIQVLQLNTVTYGFASASFLATRCIFQVGEECSDSTIREIIQKDFLCDDLLTGAETEADLLYIQQSVSTELAEHGFHLRKYRSNLPNLLSAESIGCEDRNLMISNATSTLGVGWNPSSDELNFNIQYTPPDVLTKRSILSSTFKIYDPLGILALCTIKPKILLQQLWEQKLEWDTPVSKDISKSWLKFTEQLPMLSTIKIPRRIVINNFSTIELHCFNDASQKAYGSTIYLRSLDADGNINVSLVCAKSRVAPIKPTTIPRLELCAALLGAQLANTVMQALRHPISHQIYWTDSNVVLGWIRSPAKAKTFVANRIAAINDLTDPSAWRKIGTASNPADLVSRGVDPDQVHSPLWWHGPTFLMQPEESWPVEQSCAVDLPEMKAQSAFVGETALTCDDKIINLDNYSSLFFVQNILARVQRFIHNSRNPTNKLTGPLSTDERQHALTNLIKISQQESFAKEVDLLSNDKPLKSQIALTSLNPFLDSTGVLRVGGRIDTSFYSYDKRHPIVLKSDNRLTKLIFQHEHKRLFHAGPQQLLASIRERYWPIGGRNLARRVYRECFVCRRFRAKTMTQIMGNLPSERVEPDFPFRAVSTDFAGPFFIADRKGRGCKITKCYLCVFICCRYKCIDLQAVSALTKEAFLLTLKRFIARRGIPNLIFCDNGRNFVSAAKEIKDLFKVYKNSIIDFAADQGIEFRFAPAYSPHFSGLAESGVAAAKRHIHRILKNTHLTYEELASLFSQIEAILNSRPLCPLSTSPNDFSPLTPGHFLIGRPLTSLPSPCLLDANTNRLDRFQRLELARQHFWKRWSNEYIAELQQRTKWRTKTAELKLNDLVLIKEETPPLFWRLGRVSKLFYGPDGIPRVADIATAQGATIRRALNRLVLLPRPEEA